MEGRDGLLQLLCEAEERRSGVNLLIERRRAALSELRRSGEDVTTAEAVLHNYEQLCALMDARRATLRSEWENALNCPGTAGGSNS
jgi:hypothetical protein